MGEPAAAGDDATEADGAGAGGGASRLHAPASGERTTSAHVRLRSMTTRKATKDARAWSLGFPGPKLPHCGFGTAGAPAPLCPQIRAGAAARPVLREDPRIHVGAAHLSPSPLEYVEPLGEGGMAQVYAALVRGPFGTTRLVAVKRIRDMLARD